MLARSSIKIERDFFRIFFRGLQQQNKNSISLNDPEVYSRFLRVYEYLRQQSIMLKDPELTRLAQKLRPDPITGTVPALDKAIINMQPSDVRAPNPDYRQAEISCSKESEERALERFDVRIRDIVKKAPEVFLEDL